MLRTPTWSKYLTLIVLFLGLLFALPNALPDKVLAKFPSWLPSHKVSLGLDLRGGSSLQMEIDLGQVQADKAETLMNDIRAAMRKGNVAITDLAAKGNTVQLRVTDPASYNQAKSLIQDPIRSSMDL